MLHGTKKVDKNVRHPYTTAVSVSRFFPSSFSIFTKYDLENNNKKSPPKQTKHANQTKRHPQYSCLGSSYRQ